MGRVDVSTCALAYVYMHVVSGCAFFLRVWCCMRQISSYPAHLLCEHNAYSIRITRSPCAHIGRALAHTDAAVQKIPNRCRPPPSHTHPMLFRPTIMLMGGEGVLSQAF